MIFGHTLSVHTLQKEEFKYYISTSWGGVGQGGRVFYLTLIAVSGASNFSFKILICRAYLNITLFKHFISPPSHPLK